MAGKMVKTFKAEIRSIDEKNFTVEAVVSDASMDRYGEIVSMDAWKKGLKQYKAHPVLLSSHDYNNLQNQIGMAEKVWVEDEALVARFKYFVGEGNKEADWGFRLAQKGIAAYSIGFIPKEVERPEYVEGKMGKTVPWRIYKEVELLEISHVLIPANANARMKYFDDEDPLAREMAFEIEGKALDLGCADYEQEEEEIGGESEPLTISTDEMLEEKSTKEPQLVTITLTLEELSDLFVKFQGVMVGEIKNLFSIKEKIEVEEKTVEELENIDNDESEDVYIKQIMEQLDDITKIFRSDDKVNEQGNELDK
jgi:HK97 family phage prohead protease